MADLKVRNLDDVVASALKARARAKGCLARRGGTPDPRGFGHGGLVKRANTLHAAAGGKQGKPEPDGARIIGEERDPGADGCVVEN